MKSLSKTPAPKKDRIYGSKVNPKGSASSEKSASSIKLSSDIIVALTNKLKEFRETHKTKKVSLSDLKAVYRRGLGAYSSSHRPTITGGKPNTRNAWAMARVNAFLRKAGGGEAKKTYVQDDDLLKMHLGGDMSKHLAPNGKPSNLTHEQWHLVRTPEFKAWFGDWEKNPESASKVVDENGEPMVVYHGTQSSFNKFKKQNTYFTNSKKYIKKLLGNDFNIKEVFLNNSKVCDLTNLGTMEISFLTFLKECLKQGAKKDYASLEELEEYVGKDKYMVWQYFRSDETHLSDMAIDWLGYFFDLIIYENSGVYGAKSKTLLFISNKKSKLSTQIKLADGTNTTFDGSNPDIRYEDGGEVNNCKKFILQNKSVLTNGFYFDMHELSKLFDPYGQVPLNLDFTLVSYNSGGQSGLNVIDTINSTQLISELTRLTNITKNQAYVVAHYFMDNAKRLTDISQITTEKIVVVDRDRVVCENLNEYADGGDIGQEIICRRCGWHWNTNQSDEFDKYICHNCNFDNRTFYDADPIGYKDGGSTDNYPFVVIIRDIKNPNDQIKSVLNKYRGAYAKIFDILNEDSIFQEILSEDDELKENDLYVYFSSLPDADKIERISKLPNVEIMNRYENGGEVDDIIIDGIKSTKEDLTKLYQDESRRESYGIFNFNPSKIEYYGDNEQTIRAIREYNQMTNPYNYKGELKEYYMKFVISTIFSKASFRKFGNEFRKHFDKYFSAEYNIERLRNSSMTFQDLASYIIGDGSYYIESEQDFRNFAKAFNFEIPKKEDSKFKDGGEVDDKKKTYEKWKSLVNMSKSELEKFYNSEEGNKAGLTPSQAKASGIDSGRESARWIMRMKDTPVSEWTSDMWRWAKKQISFISRMSGNKGPLYDDKGRKTRKHTSLLIWGHNPEKKNNGGTINKSIKTNDMDNYKFNQLPLVDTLKDKDQIIIKESVFAGNIDKPTHLGERYIHCEVMSKGGVLSDFNLKVIKSVGANPLETGKIFTRPIANVLTYGRKFFVEPITKSIPTFKQGGLNPDNKEVKQYFSHDSGNAGGVLVGKRHSEGGIKAINKSTGQPLEMEGGEVVITRGAVSNNKKYAFQGKEMTTREILSKLNVDGGGVSFAEGGDVPDKMNCGCDKMDFGGTTMSVQDFVNRSDSEYQTERLRIGIQKERNDHYDTLSKLNAGTITIEQALREIAQKEMKIDSKYPFAE